MSRFVLPTLLVFFCAVPVYAQEAGSMMQMDGDADMSDIRLCDSRNPASWREAQTVEGVAIEEDSSCSPDMPALIAAAVKGTNNISMETLNATGLAPDAVVKEDDIDGDGDPDVIRISLEIIGLNEGTDSITPFEIAPGITPGFWAFAPKATGMATENMSAAHLARMPSPSIRIEAGDQVYLTVENTHYMPHTVHLHGVDHPYVSEDGEGNDGVPQTSEMPIQPGERRTYEINPRTAGTMAYHCHVKPDVHVLMGLSGMFIIEENRPNNELQTINVGAGKVRHRSVDSTANYDGEFDLHYQDIDKEMHELVQGTNDPRVVTQRVDHGYDITERTADYFILNGRSFPYTLRESQLIVDPNNQYRLRVLNIGSETLSLHTHGHKVLVKALDGIDLQPAAQYYRDVVDIHAAQRADLILDTTNDGLNSYGAGVWLFHDHEEKHITTDGVSPGGGLSMITYRSFLGEQGMPILQGMDVRQYFTPEFYDRHNAQASETTNTMDISTLHILLVSLGGLLFAFMATVFVLRKKHALLGQGGYAVLRFTCGVSIICVFLLVLLSTSLARAADMEGIEGIHIMPDGSVMLGTGETLEDARVTSNGMIRLSNGEILKPVLDMRSDKTLGVKEEPAHTTPPPPPTPTPVPSPASTDDNTDMMDAMGMSNGSVSTEQSNLGMEGMDGIHIMPNGRVMTGTGVWLNDAMVNSDGIIVLGSGETIEPILDMRAGNGIRRTENTMVVNENFDRLPLGCSEISGEKHITVKAGAEIAEDFPGTAFTYDTHSFEDIAPCTLLTVTFENVDDVRHQFMVHDLPPDTYPMGMFNIEVTGPGKETGTFITPPGDDTLFVHCGVPEHEAKGMIAQIKNGAGDGDLKGIPGLTRELGENMREFSRMPLTVSLVGGGPVLGLLLGWVYVRRRWV